MYTPPSLRVSNAYRSVAATSSVDGASAHRLIELLFDGLLQSLAAARGAMERNEIATKGLQIQRAVRFIDEGLKGGLDDARGGELASRLRSLYDYCVDRLTTANLKNDALAVAEVAALISPLAQGWKEIGRTVAGQPT
ncbi:MAG: flagellar export chaperone FliS [Burkholderiales bacterium]